MPRPRGRRRIRFNPGVTYYKPVGVPMRMLGVVELNIEEAEALRLKNIKDLNQTECAKIMNTSQKISTALVEGKAIKIIQGH